MNFQSQDLRDLARGQPCQFNVPGVCNHRDETTVWAHSNEQRHGKGRGIKAHDCYGAFACSACHHWYDVDPTPSRTEKQAAFRDAFEATVLFIWTRGLIGVVKRGHLPAARRQQPTLSPIPKILPRSKAWR